MIGASVLAVVFLWPRPSPDFAVRVSMPAGQCWSGNLTVDGVRSPQSGCGVATLDVQDDCETIVALFQRDPSAQGTLEVDILQDGHSIQSSNSTFGTVAVSASCVGNEPVM